MVASVALVWFHAASVAAGWNIVAGMAGLHGTVAAPGAFDAERTDLAGGALVQLYVWIAAGLGIALIPPNTLELLRHWQPAIGMPRGPGFAQGFAMTRRWAFATAALAVAGVLGLGRVSEFLYWQF